MTSVALSPTALDRIASSIQTPNYDRSQLKTGIVHIGVGNFFRAHQAWYLHRLLQQGHARDWAIVGAGVRETDSVMREKLYEQDFLTTLIQLDPAGKSAEVIGSLIAFLPVEEDNASLVAKLVDPAIRIVSMTITESGYYRTGAGTLDLDHKDVAHDVHHHDRPKTAFGALIAALRIRRDRDVGPFTILSCDNLVGNGDIVRDTVLSLANAIDATLSDWIRENVTFPNSMVDCIVPATGPEERQLVADIGRQDSVPVTHEAFRQWVIEDRFCAGRPPWEMVGAVLTNDVLPYEAMKLRILNAGHQVLANIGELLGIDTIAECIADRDTRSFFNCVQKREIVPYVSNTPETSAVEYLQLIEERFNNPLIRDTSRRVSFDGSSRHPGFVHPIIRDALAVGGEIKGLALVEAIWARMCLGVRENGSVIDANDPRWLELRSCAEAAAANPETWIEQEPIYGDLADSEVFRSTFVDAYISISELGCREAIRRFTSGD